MAIFIASTKPISRSNGQSAVASASYRAGVELEDKRYDKTHDYSKRHGVMSADIILPTTLKEQDASIDRSELWNLAEQSETRKNSRVAREWLINLPHELDEDTRKELAHNFTQSLADKFDVIADCAIHKPTAREIERGADARNFHAHIMLTTRKAELGEDGKIILTDKSDCELSDTQRKAKGMSRAKDEVTEIRELWEHIANEKLVEYNHDLIDSRSYAAQGIDIIPQEKMGSVATKLERDKYEQELEKAEKAAEQGKVYEIDETPATIRGEVNRLIAERNSEVWSAHLLDNQKVNDAADKIIFESRANNEREQSNDRLRAAIAGTTKISEWADTAAEWTDKRIASVNSRIESVSDNTRRIEQRIDVSQQWIDSNSSRARDSKRALKGFIELVNKSDKEIERPVTSPAFTAPTPFDDNARRARAAKLDEQQRRADRDARKHSYSDARVAESAGRVKMMLSGKLLSRNHDNNRVRWEWYEKEEEHPQKFDRRQIEQLDKFAESLGIQKSRNIASHEQWQEVAAKFTSEFIAQNKPIIELLKNPQSERERYNNVTKDFDDFKKYIDDKRTEFNASIVEKLGGSGGEVGRMTRDIISSFSYLNALDTYIADDSRADEAKEVAKLHRADTINKTCQQFKYALPDVHRLSLNEREKHTDALSASLNTFTEQHSPELSKDQHTAIQSGISSFNHNQDRVVTQNRGLSR